MSPGSSGGSGKSRTAGTGKRPRSGRSTIEDVAALAGVGRSTASRVVAGTGYVSETARRAVEDAVVKLGYVPNAAARSLATRRTEALAFVISDSELQTLQHAFFGGVLRGISREAAACARQLVLALNEDEQRLDDYLGRQLVDGVLLMAMESEDPRPWQIRRTGVPMVIAGCPQGWTAGSYVAVDNHGGAVTAVEHLISAGCRRIVMIAGPSVLTDARDRYDGYVAALRSAGRIVDPNLVVDGDYQPDSGERAMRALLERDPELDGVFAANDRMAIGALRTLRAAGRRVPEDVRIVGFDDDPAASASMPALTTVAQPVEEMGRQMVRMLVSQIESNAASSEPVVLPTELRVRATT